MKEEEEEIARKSSDASILPDVEFGEKAVPPETTEKAESLEDELEKRQSQILENGNGVDQVKLSFNWLKFQFFYGRLANYDILILAKPPNTSQKLNNYLKSHNKQFWIA